MDCLTECQKQEEAYIIATHSYFNNLSLIEVHRLKTIMSRPFSSNEQLLESKKIIKDCAQNKLGLDNTNLPFGWIKGSPIHCKNEADILGTWFTTFADCLPMWHNLIDRVAFYETCLKKYDIQQFKRKGIAATKKLQNLAFELHKEEELNANNQIGGRSAMIASGIMDGIGVRLTPFTAGGSLELSALKLTGSALSLSETFETMFGDNPQIFINDATKELQELQDDGNSIAMLLLMYMVSHEDLENFIHYNNDYTSYISKYERDIRIELSRNKSSGAQALNGAILSRKLIPETAFSRSVKKCIENETTKNTKTLEKIMRISMLGKIHNIKAASHTKIGSGNVPKLFRNEKAVRFLDKIQGFPLLCNAFNVGLGIWEVFQGKKELRKGLHHHVKLASRKTLLMTEEVIEAYVHTLENANYIEPMSMEEEMYAVYVHISDNDWDYNAGMLLKFQSNGKRCLTNPKPLNGASKGWFLYGTRSDLGTCHSDFFKIVNEDLSVSLTSEQDSVFADILNVDIVQVATNRRYLPTFQTNYSSEMTVSGTSESVVNRLHPIRNRLIEIKTHTSTASNSGTDTDMMIKLTYSVPNEGNGVSMISLVSSMVKLNTFETHFENDQVDLFAKDLFKLGMDDFFDFYPIGRLSDELVEGDITISFKLDTKWTHGGDWNVDLIKLYFIGMKGQQIVLMCHFGEEWISSDNIWHHFPCELHKPENPLISVDRIGLSVCDESDAGSNSNRIQLKFCRNAGDFSQHNFQKAVDAGRCCKTNYFSGSYTSGATTYVDGNTAQDDGGEKLGQCEGFEITTSSFSMLVDNDNSDAVCFNNIEFYGTDDKSLTSATYPIPFRSCSIPNLWAESGSNNINHDCTYRSYDDSRSSFKCHLNSNIKFSYLKIGICDRDYAASYDPFIITICDGNEENCCTTDTLNTDQLFNSYGIKSGGSYVKEIDTLSLGTCKDKLLSDNLAIKINLMGSDGLCTNYFQLGGESERSINATHNITAITSTTCQHGEVHADSNEARICPRSDSASYDKFPIHCPGTEGNTLQKISIMVSDQNNAGSSDDIRLIIRNSAGDKCETTPLRTADTGHYKEFTQFGEECKNLQISDYVHVWVATVNYNDDLYLNHLYLDVVFKTGQTKSMACILDQEEEFFVIVHSGTKRFGVPLKCM